MLHTKKYSRAAGDLIQEENAEAMVRQLESTLTSRAVDGAMDER